MFERFLFSKIETWIVLLLAILAVAGTVLFGNLVWSQANGRDRLGAAGRAAVEIAKGPDTLKAILEGKDERVASRTERFEGRSGWTFPDSSAPKSDGYLLLSRYSGDEDRHLVELLDLSDYSVKYTWRPDADVLLAGLPHESEITGFARWNRRLFEAVHPYLMPNGDLIIKDHQTPLIRIDHCSDMVWRNNDRHYHHSTNMGPDGTFWVPSLIEPGDPRNAPKFFTDGLAEVSPDGELLQEISLPDIFERHGMMARLYTAGSYLNDALHLNDIEPVLEDGPYWRKGDLFLSMRHKSMVMLYRPSTDEIVWMKEGPWLAQHDVDILDDHRIAIFNNNAYDRGKGWYILDTSAVDIYDFATGTVTVPDKDAFGEIDLKTLTEGLAEHTASGHLILEEENSGRLLILSPERKLIAEFINRARDGRVFGLAWSRYVPREYADTALAALQSAPPCQ